MTFKAYLKMVRSWARDLSLAELNEYLSEIGLETHPAAARDCASRKEAIWQIASIQFEA
jgi:hypothetical protein